MIKWTDTPQTAATPCAAPRPTGPAPAPCGGAGRAESIAVMRGILSALAIMMMLTAFALAAFAPPREALAVVVAPMLAILGGTMLCLIRTPEQQQP